MASPITTISNGELGSSVRSKLNTLITDYNQYLLLVHLSTTGSGQTVSATATGNPVMFKANIGGSDTIENIDQNGDWNNTTGVFTAPSTGFYDIQFCNIKVVVGGTTTAPQEFANANYGLYFKINGTEYKVFDMDANNANSKTYLINQSFPVYLTAADTLEFVSYTAQGYYSGPATYYYNSNAGYGQQSGSAGRIRIYTHGV
jgi:hypothetical protein